jgi:hypothetical protein
MLSAKKGQIAWLHRHKKKRATMGALLVGTNKSTQTHHGLKEYRPHKKKK